MNEKLPEKLFIHKDELDYALFVPVPVELIKAKEFRNISADAKLLYGFLLSRTFIANKNKMFDENERLYVFMTIEEVMETFNVASTKAKCMFKELTNIDGFGTGLILKERVQGKPSKIFVLKFDEVYEMLRKN